MNFEIIFQKHKILDKLFFFSNVGILAFLLGTKIKQNWN